MYKTTLIVLTLIACAYAGCPSIISRSQWGAANAKKETNIGKNQLYAIIHHTETPQCDSLTSCKNRVKSIQNYHMNTRKWDDIGYNFVVDPLGNIFEGRGWGKQGAHAPNYNSKSIGISVIGNYDNTEPNSQAVEAVKNLISCGVSIGEISSNYKLLGHRQTRSTDCPGNKFYALIKTWPHWSAQP